MSSPDSSGDGFGDVTAEPDARARAVRALKRIPASSFPDMETCMRVLSQTRAAGSLGEGLVPVLQASPTSEGELRITMPWLEGSPLGSLLEPRRRYDPRAVVGLVKSVARSLDALHELGLAHHRLSPRAIFLADGRRGPRTVLLGSGLAPLVAPHIRVERAAKEPLVEEPWLPYLAPEALSLTGRERAADVYALGVIAFELLAGQPPFARRRGLMEAVLDRKRHPPRLSSVARVPYPPSLERAVGRALRLRPSDRFESASELAAALEAAIDRPVGREAAALRVFLGGDPDGDIESSNDLEATALELTPAEVDAGRIVSRPPPPMNRPISSRPPSSGSSLRTTPVPLRRPTPSRIESARRRRRRAGSFEVVSEEMKAQAKPSEPPSSGVRETPMGKRALRNLRRLFGGKD
ncbi:MAG: protein kinase [Myxococcota bacterium]|nr:protein kinase [Myxococcota bacterium]